MNYPEYYAAYIRENATGANVFSNIDPARNWDGETIIEIGEDEETNTTWFISGDSLIDRKIIVTCRSETRDAAAQYMKSIKRLIDRASDLLTANEQIEGWNVADEGVSPDIRGVVAGDSFYSFYVILITERVIA